VQCYVDWREGRASGKATHHQMMLSHMEQGQGVSRSLAVYILYGETFLALFITYIIVINCFRNSTVYDGLFKK